MHATDIVGWTNGTGCIFCPDCEPEACDEKSPVFADNEGWERDVCDGCGERLDPNYTAPEAIIVSEGTLRTCDLVPAFLDALSEYAPAAYQQVAMPGCGFTPWPSDAMGDESHEWWQTESADDVLSMLTDALDEHAPEDMYFGASEGDGACFGFWPCEVANG